jgi:RNA polymerase-binding transcription factor DksA
VAAKAASAKASPAKSSPSPKGAKAPTTPPTSTQKSSLKGSKKSSENHVLSGVLDDATLPPVVFSSTTSATEKKAGKPKFSSAFLSKQRQLILEIRDQILDSLNGVAKDTLRSRAEGSEASAFGMHQADAGSDAYERDFALSLFTQEQDHLYEIDEALKRIENGTYGICELSGESIPTARLEAQPFARYTVACQTEFEKQKRVTRPRTPVTSLFGLTDEEAQETPDEEEQAPEPKE